MHTFDKSNWSAKEQLYFHHFDNQIFPLENQVNKYIPSPPPFPAKTLALHAEDKKY